MSKSSLIGIIIGWSIVFVSIRLATDNVLMFWDLNSFILVLIGPYFAMLDRLQRVGRPSGQQKMAVDF